MGLERKEGCKIVAPEMTWMSWRVRKESDSSKAVEFPGNS